MSADVSLQERVTVGGIVYPYTRSKSAGSLKQISEPVNDGSTDLEIAFTLDYSECKFFLIEADVAMTIETNDGTTPDDTLTLVADEPYVWAEGMLHTFLIGTDITSIFATNSSGTNGTLTIFALEDPTP